MDRRVLVVVSSYSPAMNADIHRARHLGWTLRDAGWDIEILSPSASFQFPEQIESDSGDFFCKDVPVHVVNENPRKLFRRLWINSVGWRSLFGMYKAGVRLLRTGRFALVYISTTNFPLMLLGPLWCARYGVPFVLDIHDPIHKRAKARPVLARPALKHRLANFLGGSIETLSVRNSAGLVSVSPAYLEQLRTRYGAKPEAVIPFAVLPRDHESVAKANPANLSELRLPIVYVGAGGAIMQRSFRLLCDTLAELRRRNPQLAAQSRIELFGTQMGWREGGTPYLQAIARERRLDDLVSESPARVTYRRSLEILHDAGGAMILGVDDAGYMPSKLYSYAYSGKPLLAIVRKNGPAFAALQELGPSVHTIWFDAGSEMPREQAAGVLAEFMEDVKSGWQFDRRNVLELHGAAAMARQHADFFEHILLGRASVENRVAEDISRQAEWPAAKPR
jgi:hypothetical protein